MAEPRRVAVATFGRSDFSILRPLCRLLAADPAFDSGLWVGGAHFEDSSGRTVADIEASGLSVWAEVNGGSYDRTPLGTVSLMSAQLAGFGELAAASDVDLVLILGDRFEAVAAGLAMVPLGVPVGHISGGSITEGAFDDVFRHCLTKIAAVHFCELPRFAQRIHHMGEDPARIFTTGALGLDAFAAAERRPFDDFVRQFDLAGLEPGFVLATLHPETGRPEVTTDMAAAMVAALLETHRQVVYTYPNADPGSDAIGRLIEVVSDRRGTYGVRSFGADWYPTAMEHAGLMIGNSSGGIIEAASFGLPVVDIGDRQKGRERGANVIHSERDQPAISAAIERALDPGFAEVARRGNIYGDGRGGRRVVAALKGLEWAVLRRPKPFVDPDPAFVGALMEVA